MPDGTIRCTVGLTESEVLAANLAALGLSADSVRTDDTGAGDRVLAAYREVIAAEGRPVSAVEVARYASMSNSRVAAVARQLFDAGRMLRAVDKKSGKVVYLPKAEAE